MAALPAQGVEADLRPVFLHRPQLAGVLEQDAGCVDRVAGDAVGVAVDEALQFLGAAVGLVAGHPAGDVVARRQDSRLDALLVLQPVRHHLELQLADRAEQQHRAGDRTEYLDRAWG